MATFDEELSRVAANGATVYGVSTDLPWALRAFAREEALSFGLIGDTNRETVTAYGVELDFANPACSTLADRAVVVVDADRTVGYTWRADDPSEEPPYEAALAAVEAAAD